MRLKKQTLRQIADGAIEDAKLLKKPEAHAIAAKIRKAIYEPFGQPQYFKGAIVRRRNQPK